MKFNVPDMSCGHCISAIEKSIKAMDGGARVNCDLSARSVEVDSDLPQEAVSAAMKDAGYDSTPVAG